MTNTIGEPYWDDAPVYLIGGGTSLRGFDFRQIHGKGLIVGVNDGAFYADADVLFSLDASYARKRWKEILGFKGEAWLAIPPNHEVWNRPQTEHVNKVQRGRGDYLSEDPEWIYGVNSGFGALNLAYLKRAKRVYLLGYDMYPDADGDIHFHEGYEWEGDAKRAARYYKKWVNPFEYAAEQLARDGVKVVNANPHSRIEAFEKCNLEDL